MKLIQRLGGRKFLLALISIGVGTAIELMTSRGLTVNMAGLLGGIVAAFSTANYLNTREFERARVAEKSARADKTSQEDVASSSQLEYLSSQVDELSSRISTNDSALTEIGIAVGNTQKIIKAAIGLGNTNQ